MRAPNPAARSTYRLPSTSKTFVPCARAYTIGSWSLLLSCARAARRASTEGDSTAASLAANSRERGPGGLTRMSGSSCPHSVDHAIASCPLRLIELLVGPLDEVL